MSKEIKALKKLAKKKDIKLKIDSGVYYVVLDNEIDIAVDDDKVEIRFMQISLYDGSLAKGSDVYELYKKVYKFSEKPTPKKYANVLKCLVEMTNHTRIDTYRLELSEISPVVLVLTNNENYRIRAYTFKELFDNVVNVRELDKQVEENI